MTLDRTPNRLRAVNEVLAGRVEWHHFLKPEAYNTATGGSCIDVIAVLANHGIVDIGTPKIPGGRSVPTLTEYGREWAGLPAPIVEGGE